MKTILLILAALPAFAQQTVNYVATTGNVSLSGAGTAATLQQPATNAAPVAFPGSFPLSPGMPPVGADVYCSVACVATISRNCTTPASATAGSVVSIVPNVPAASVTFWTASNASSCTTLRVINIGAGQDYPIDLSQFNLSTSGTTSNLHISIGSITGTVNISFYPVEQH
jgi:hypothetical protein